MILAGRTGSGKTDLLTALERSCGAQTLDLEGLANHRGSTFGALGKEPQPTTEQYEVLFSLTRPISPICQSPFFPYLTLKSFVFRTSSHSNGLTSTREHPCLLRTRERTSAGKRILNTPFSHMWRPRFSHMSETNASFGSFQVLGPSTPLGADACR